VRVWDAFTELLKARDLGVEDLNQDRLYTFLINHPRFFRQYSLSLGGEIYLMSVFDRVGKSAVHADVVKESKLPRLQSKRFTVYELFAQGQFIAKVRKMYQTVNE
jgi:hypothetical protein